MGSRPMGSLHGRRAARRAAVGLALACWLALAVGCGGARERAAPNVLWVVWDTVRADRLSLYGYEKPTTPRLDEWARGARVFENAVSTASSTVPSHGAMFTGLLPSRHGANNGHRWLDDAHETIAERFRDAGYRTYLWAANPHISAAENFQQGFEVEEHPWDPSHRARALQIVREKAWGTRLGGRLARGQGGQWAIKAAGELAEPSLVAWLESGSEDRPFFAFLNYMEAHRPFVPSRRYRERMMSPEQVERSYDVDRSWIPMWSYTFGLHDYGEEELAVMAATYDATLRELDDLFASLIETLEARGHLENTIVVLTADHGEHLGEHHMLDHQYSLYDPLIRVPLVLYYPPRVEPGRDPRPVVNADVRRTLLDLAGIEASVPDGISRSLLSPADERARVAEYPAVFTGPFDAVREEYPHFDPAPWSRRLRALYEGPHKLIWHEDGETELYDLRRDPGELHDLAESDPETAARLSARLAAIAPPLDSGAGEPVPTLSDEQRAMLEDLGYLAPGEEGGASASGSR
jgi:arylsulfatase A-like enzyme